MRIIGGIAAGRILQVPKGLGVRPTPDLVKQALFNSLGPRILEARVLDLFSGSGALGLESLSRGASQVLSIEKLTKIVYNFFKLMKFVINIVTDGLTYNFSYLSLILIYLLDNSLFLIDNHLLHIFDLALDNWLLVSIHKISI